MSGAPGAASVPQSYVDSCGSLPVAIHPAEPETLKVFPNPSNGKVHVQSGIGIVRIRVIDALGREVAKFHPESGKTSLDLPGTGPHWLKIELEDGTFASRMVVRM